MTTRTDIDYDLSRSPRVAEVMEPSIEVIMQDYVDTTRPFESSFAAMSHPFLMSASGKEDLGGGVTVSITITEEDLKLAFQPRTTSAQAGSVTTGSSAPVRGEIHLFDTSALFITNEIMRGSLVINYSDFSVADVQEIVSETELITRTLVNGTTNSFQIGDVYDVFNIIQCTTTGGNLVANDANDITFPAILPTAFTQVIQQTSSSGTIQNLSSIEADIATIIAQTTSTAIGAAVWDALISAHSVTGSFGEFIVRRLLTVAKYFSLRT